MDFDTRNRNQLFQTQNIQLKKEIKQLDMNLLNEQYLYNKQDSKPSNKLINFMVIGPYLSGKTSLLRTLHYAYNGFFPHPLITKVDHTLFKSYEIKKNNKVMVEGTKVKQIEQQKYNIVGMELQWDKGQQKIGSKYKNILEYVDEKISSCSNFTTFFGQKKPSLYQNVPKVCLIVLNIIEDIRYDESTYLKFLKNDLQERGIKILYILTHLDKLQVFPEQERIIYMDQRITSICIELDITDREDVFSMQNYKWDKRKDQEENGKEKIALSQLGMSRSTITKKIICNEQINYYSLTLLIRLIKEVDSNANVGKDRCKSNIFGWICGCN